MVKNNNTEQLILETAGNVFLTRGFDGTRMQEIADEAGINKALVHYYFRNKEKLFGAVLNATFREVGARVFEFVNAPVSLEVKIGKIVEAYIEIIKTKPRLPLFVINEVNVNPERILKYLNFHEFFDIYLFGLRQ